MAIMAGEVMTMVATMTCMLLLAEVIVIVMKLFLSEADGGGDDDTDAKVDSIDAASDKDSGHNGLDDAGKSDSADYKIQMPYIQV